ncbi:peroxisomal fatty acid beta-oxidation multifunctional protein MFP2-like isoform X2 [Gossypium hirsutum]|uniref:Peroxisomal fatty acid beta-oxidation multifunctional protein MFP2-like isoform X2 n=1 Tax=Gossypium hirsutum TaxID=3635 RepID=A0ABM2Z850_GOSHI|nr:peroxisomal fatty acid beta-oxidation multifunctional protein MFP2-like isoform X2 [Gossypium hirsutum]
MMDFVGFEVATAMKIQLSKNFGERFNVLSKLISVMQENIQAGTLSALFLIVADNLFGTLLDQKLNHLIDIWNPPSLSPVSDETTRKGFYIYDGESKFTPNPDIKMYVNEARSISGLSIDYELMQLSDEEIVEMILFPVVNEACCVLEDKIVVKASDLDVASVTGEESFSGLILLDQNIYVQNWRNGQRLMDRSSSPAPI